MASRIRPSTIIEDMNDVLKDAGDLSHEDALDLRRVAGAGALHLNAALLGARIISGEESRLITETLIEWVADPEVA